MRKLRLRRIPFSLLCMLLCFAATCQAATYRLKPVTSVKDGGKYVFELDGSVMINSITAKSEGGIPAAALLTTDTYNTFGLTTEDYVWELSAKGSGFRIKELSSSRYLSNTKSGSTDLDWQTTASNATVWTFAFQSDGSVLITNPTNSNRFLGYFTASVHVYKAYAQSNMDSTPYKIKVYELVDEDEAYPFTLSSARYATFCYPSRATDFTGLGVYPYTAQVVGDEVRLSLIADGVVPAGQGVIVYGETAGDYDVPVASSEPTVVSTGLSISDGITAKGENVYVLGQKNDIVGFYHWTSETSLSAGRVYLDAASAPSRGYLAFAFGGEPAGVEAARAAISTPPSVFYNLSGQQVLHPSRGIYVSGGRKIVVRQ